MASFGSRIRHAWNAFTNQQTDTPQNYADLGVINFGPRPDRHRSFVSNERSIIESVYNRIAVDVAQAQIKHVRLDENGRFLDDISSAMDNCLNVQANIDQQGTQFRQDIAATLLDRGTAAIVPIDTTLDPSVTGGYDINTMRVGDIVGWYPAHVKVNVYNEKIGRRQVVTLEKKYVAIVENPFYAVMNEPNSTLQRIIRKLNLLDAVDEQSSSGKLDLIIQLPYVIKSEARQQQANARREQIATQLKGSQYGIAYTDGTEKITQLNRPVTNNLMEQIQYLTTLLFSQLGITQEVMDGSADEQTMTNYSNRTVAPIITAIVEAMKAKFLTNTARTQNQSIEFYMDPFRFLPLSEIAQLADVFTRNEIATSNEIRQAIGMRPSKDPKADQLNNSNMPGNNPVDANGNPVPTDGSAPPVAPTPDNSAAANQVFDDLSSQVDDILGGKDGNG